METESRRILVHARGRMTPDETSFWERLQTELHRHEIELTVIAHHLPATETAVPILRLPVMLDQVRLGDLGLAWVPDHSISGWSVGKWSEEELLERDSLWNGEPPDARSRLHRAHALRFFREFYDLTIRTLHPCLVIIWNGHHAQEILLGELARSSGIPVGFVERGPFQNTLQCDWQGILGDSSVTAETDWSWESEQHEQHWIEVFHSIKDIYTGGTDSWWGQPGYETPASARKRLGIKKDDDVVLFAGQVDEDSQNFFFAPMFHDNLEAFRFFCGQLDGREEVFVLGKHHPKSTRSAHDFASALRTRGRWVEVMNIHSALQSANRVACVNSSVMYEAMMYGKPVLSMGTSLISNKGIAYEITNRSEAQAVIHAWLAETDWAGRLSRFNNFSAWLLKNHLFAMTGHLENIGLRGCAELADLLHDRAEGRTRPPVETGSGSPVLLGALSEGQFQKPQPDSAFRRWTRKIVNLVRKIPFGENLVAWAKALVSIGR